MCLIAIAVQVFSKQDKGQTMQTRSRMGVMCLTVADLRSAAALRNTSLPPAAAAAACERAYVTGVQVTFTGICKGADTLKGSQACACSSKQQSASHRCCAAPVHDLSHPMLASKQASKAANLFLCACHLIQISDLRHLPCRLTTVRSQIEHLRTKPPEHNLVCHIRQMELSARITAAASTQND
jgi:hypothetical protein